MAVLPFYGTDRPDLFAIERTAMDRSGHVIAALDACLPAGRVVDVGAGSGFTAAALQRPHRTVIGLEPALAMIDRSRTVPWVMGEAEYLPFADAAFDGAYATWAYFFTRGWDPSPGLAELRRVVKPSGVLAIVDNLGDDEFTSMTPDDISADVARWEQWGFECTVIETAFEFESIEDARTLLEFYFGPAGLKGARLTVEFRVGLFTRPASSTS